MASIPQLRPRSAEADGSLSRVSSEHVFEADVEAKASSGAGESNEHSHSAMSAQRLLHSAGQRLPAVLGVTFVVMLIVVFTGMPNLPRTYSQGRQATIPGPYYPDATILDAADWTLADPASYPTQTMANDVSEAKEPNTMSSSPETTSAGALSTASQVLSAGSADKAVVESNTIDSDSKLTATPANTTALGFSNYSSPVAASGFGNNTSFAAASASGNYSFPAAPSRFSNYTSSAAASTSGTYSPAAASGFGNHSSSTSASASGNFTTSKKKTANADRQCPALVVPHQYQPDGHPPNNHAQAHIVHSPKTLAKPPEERVLIVAAHSGGSCSLQLGDYYTFLSMLDKLQYANLHGYDVLLGMGNIDSKLLATWNKVGWMMKALNDTPRVEAEWILWMDLDTIAVESDIALPLESYAGKDLVLWILPDEVLEGNPMRLNTGVMLIRNTEWARGFIADVARLGRQHVLHWWLMDEVLKEELQGAPFASGLFDQNVIAYLMKRYPANIMPHVYAANLDFRINENWLDYIGYNFSQLHNEDDTILVSHFSGCSMCAGKDNNENLTLCELEFQRTFEFANCTYGDMVQSNDAVYTREVHAMLGQLPFCRHKPTPVQCLQYMDADQFDAEQGGQAMQASHHRHVMSEQLPGGGPLQQHSQQRLAHSTQSFHRHMLKA